MSIMKGHQIRNWGSSHGRALLTGFLSLHALLSLLSYTTPSHWSRVTLLKYMGLTFSNRALIKKMLRRLAYKPILRRHFLKLGSLFSTDPTLYQFETKGEKHEHVEYQKHTIMPFFNVNAGDLNSGPAFSQCTPYWQKSHPRSVLISAYIKPA